MKGAGCFVAGTPVLTPDGFRPIEELEVGDLVMAWDEATGKTEPRAVTDLIRPDPKLIYRITARDGDGETELFDVTDDHPWYIENVGWVETIDLRAGQRIETADDRGMDILEVAATDRVEHTYNITVEGLHTFLVGEDAAVVHNVKWCDGIIKYADRVRKRGTQDPKSHNFPYSFDRIILQTKPTVSSSGYRMYQSPGTMNGKQGVFEIGRQPNGVVNHRFFRPV